MTYSTLFPPTYMLTFPITKSDRLQSLKFAQQQPTPEKHDQVYLNTLAVLTVNHYLTMLDITTDLKSGDSWNKIMRLMSDVADLKITDIKVTNSGYLECRPVKFGQQIIDIPPDVWEERIGYLFVQFDAEYHEGTLLGFLPTISQEKISITELQPLDNFLEILYQSKINWVHLREWLEKIYVQNWQSIDEVIKTHDTNSNLAFRMGTKSLISSQDMQWLKEQNQELLTEHNFRENINLTSALAKIIQENDNEEICWKAAEILWKIEPNHDQGAKRKIRDLGMQLGGENIALMVAILPKPVLSILLRVYPMGLKNTLPPTLKLALFESDNRIAEAQARLTPLDNYIQLKIIAEYGEKFAVKVSLEKYSITEYFVV